MASSLGFGVALGVLLSAVSIAGNMRRGDAHLVSIFPDLVGVALLAISIYLITRRQRGRLDRHDLMWFGLRQVLAAAVVFAIAAAIFTQSWLRPGSGPLAYVMFLATLGCTLGIGGCAVLFAARPAPGPDSVRT